jgi:glutaredoxin
MLITLYKSSLCPRCYFAKKAILASIKEHPEWQIVEIEEIDILTSPGKAFRAGITMIPAIKIGDKKLSSLYLSRKDIEQFLTPFFL